MSFEFINLFFPDAKLYDFPGAILFEMQCHTLRCQCQTLCSVS